MTSPTTETIERVDDQTKVQLPSMYKVILHNDNVTTMDFVIYVLMKIFHKTQEEAMKITMEIHENGEGVAGAPYTKEIAEEKTLEVIGAARANNFPLVASYDEI